jgi:hypothetical protein
MIAVLTIGALLCVPFAALGAGAGPGTPRRTCGSAHKKISFARRNNSLAVGVSPTSGVVACARKVAFATAAVERLRLIRSPAGVFLDSDIPMGKDTPC